MRCVVTGVAGFVGSSITDELLAAGHEVIGIDCFTDYYARSIKESNLIQARSNKRFTFIEGNLLELDLEQLLEGVNWVFHQAAQAGVRASWGSSFAIYTDNNILATQMLLEACRSERVRPSLEKVVYASSSSVYGDAESLPTTEEMRPAPVSPYGVSKLAAEHLMVLYSKEFDVPTISLRYFTVFGPRQRPDMAFNRFSRAALTGDTITVYDDGEQSRDFTYIGDIVRANIDAAKTKHPELVMNVGGGSRVTVNQVLGHIKDIVGKDIHVKYEGRQHGDVKHTAADVSRARAALNYKPRVDVVSGLQAEIAWMEMRLELESREAGRIVANR